MPKRSDTGGKDVNGKSAGANAPKPQKSAAKARPATRSVTTNLPESKPAVARKPATRVSKPDVEPARIAVKPARSASAVVPRPEKERDVRDLLDNPKAIIPENWKDSPSRTVADLNKAELENYLKLLLEKRSELLGDVSSMADEALRRGENGEASNMPIHMAELGSDNYEQEHTLNLLENEQKMLKEIDEAILRIADGVFGVCAATGKPIGKPRLEIKPWAKHCIEYVREQERRGLM